MKVQLSAVTILSLLYHHREAYARPALNCPTTLPDTVSCSLDDSPQLAMKPETLKDSKNLLDLPPELHDPILNIASIHSLMSLLLTSARVQGSVEASIARAWIKPNYNAIPVQRLVPKYQEDAKVTYTSIDGTKSHSKPWDPFADTFRLVEDVVANFPQDTEELRAIYLKLIDRGYTKHIARGNAGRVMLELGTDLELAYILAESAELYSETEKDVDELLQDSNLPRSAGSVLDDAVIAFIHVHRQIAFAPSDMTEAAEAACLQRINKLKTFMTEQQREQESLYANSKGLKSIADALSLREANQ